MKLTEENRHYDLGDGRHASLRVLQPSGASGNWPGATRVFRVWSLVTPPDSRYMPCSYSVAAELERELGEIAEFEAVWHVTLGEVVSPC